MTERARILFRLSVQAGCFHARNARESFRTRAFVQKPAHRPNSNVVNLDAAAVSADEPGQGMPVEFRRRGVGDPNGSFF
jgi:hypothetical protein